MDPGTKVQIGIATGNIGGEQASYILTYKGGELSEEILLAGKWERDDQGNFIATVKDWDKNMFPNLRNEKGEYVDVEVVVNKETSYGREAYGICYWKEK